MVYASYFQEMSSNIENKILCKLTKQKKLYYQHFYAVA